MTNADNSAHVDIDHVLSRIGGFGRYQAVLLGLFCYINFFAALHYFDQLFIQLVPDHWCRVKEFPEGNFTPYQRHRLSAPEGESCYYYDVNFTAVYGNDWSTAEPNESWPLKYCDSGWEYDYASSYPTIATESNWVCNDEWKRYAGQSIYFGGAIVGSLIIGLIADRFGRLPALVLATMLGLVGDICTLFARELTDYAVYRFIAGLATDSNFMMMYIIVMEYTSPERRTLALNSCVTLFYGFGSMAAAGFALWIFDWKIFLLSASLPVLLVATFPAVVPESARWLASRGRYDEALKIFRRIGRINRKLVSESVFSELKAKIKNAEQNLTSKPQQYTLIDLFRTPNLRKRTLILITKSMVLNLCYDALARDVEHLDISPFLAFTLTSATIIPAGCVLLLLQDRIGRKLLASGAMLTSGIVLGGAGIVLMDGAHPILELSLILFGRFCVNVAYNSGLQYAAELLPTVVRGQGVSAAHVAGFIASFFSPQVIYLSTFWVPLPDLVLAGSLLIGAILCLFLPETLNKDLPLTLEDGENFGSDEGPCYFAFCSSYKANEPETLREVYRSTSECDVSVVSSTTSSYQQWS